MGFTVKKGFREGFSEGVLRRGVPEGALNAPLKITPPWACALSEFPVFRNFAQPRDKALGQDR